MPRSTRNGGGCGILAAVGAVICLAVVAMLYGASASKSDVTAELHRLGYSDITVESSPAFWACAKNRHVYRFRAVRDGRPASGHACAGWPMGVAINEDGQ